MIKMDQQHQIIHSYYALGMHWECMLYVCTNCNVATYRKRQKLSKIKVSRFIGFHPNVLREDSCGLSNCSSVLPLLKALVGKTFAIHRKSIKTVKLFSRVAFVAYK